MASKHFGLAVLLRVGLLGAVLVGFALAFTMPGLYASRLLLALVALLLVGELYRFVNRTNSELARFIESARHHDFTRRFETSATGAGFEELGRTFAGILEHFQDIRRAEEIRLRQLTALIEHVPVPLLSLAGDRIELRNNAARRLFGGAMIRTTDDLEPFGAAFASGLRTMRAGQRHLLDFETDGIRRRLTARMTILVTDAAPETGEQLISLQDIQSELDDVQLQSYRELVRVLTHEIMNSITPVASLSSTAADLAREALPELPTGDQATRESLEDLHQAVDTIARRSRGLLQFVENYRSLTLLPPPRKQSLVLADVFERVRRLIAAESGSVPDVEVSIEPPGLGLHADPGLLEQALINLLQNAGQALTGSERPVIQLAARPAAGGRVTITVSDNGPGIDPKIADEIFVPFFTTRPGGSGVGLALTRQIMLAHGGGITLQSTDTGATFVLMF